MPHRKGGNINKRVPVRNPTEHSPQRESAPRTEHNANTNTVNDLLNNHQNHPRLQTANAQCHLFKADLTLREDYDSLFGLYLRLLPIYVEMQQEMKAKCNFDMEKIGPETNPNPATMFAIMQVDAYTSINNLYLMIINLMQCCFEDVKIKKITDLTNKQMAKLCRMLAECLSETVSGTNNIEKLKNLVSKIVYDIIKNHRFFFKNRIDGKLNSPEGVRDTNGNFHYQFVNSIITILKTFAMTTIIQFDLQLPPFFKSFSETWSPEIDCSETAKKYGFYDIKPNLTLVKQLKLSPNVLKEAKGIKIEDLKKHLKEKYETIKTQPKDKKEDIEFLKTLANAFTKFYVDKKKNEGVDLSQFNIEDLKNVELTKEDIEEGIENSKKIWDEFMSSMSKGDNKKDNESDTVSASSDDFTIDNPKDNNDENLKELIKKQYSLFESLLINEGYTFQQVIDVVDEQRGIIDGQYPEDLGNYTDPKEIKIKEKFLEFFKNIKQSLTDNERLICDAIGEFMYSRVKIETF